MTMWPRFLVRVLVPISVGVTLGLALTHCPAWLVCVSVVVAGLVVWAAWQDADAAIRETKRLLEEFEQRYDRPKD